MMDHRTYPRVRLKVPLCITLGAEGVYRKMIPLTSQDLSGGGLCFDTSSDIPLDATSWIVVSRLGDLPQDASIEGRVRRREWDPVTGRFLVGVEFASFAGVTRDQLLEAIRRWETPAHA